MTLAWFVCIVAVLTLVVMLLIYLLVLPSLWTFRGHQMNSFDSGLLKELQVLRAEVRDLREKKSSFESDILREIRELRKEVDETKEVK